MALALGGCSSLGRLFDPSNVNYRSAQTGPGLDVPPDLIGPRADERYVIPGRGEGQTYSDYSRDRQDQVRQQASRQAPLVVPEDSQKVLVAPAGARIEREGQTRWLVVDQPPASVWPQLIAFWEAEGIPLRSDSPALGTMESEWVERVERPERSGLRGLFSRGLGTSYTTSMRDAYRTRIEPAPDGGTEVYVSQRALEEVVNSSLQDSTIWQPGPNRPDLEVEMLRRMMLRIGRVSQQQSVAAVKAAESPAGTSASSTPGVQPPVVQPPGVPAPAPAAVATAAGSSSAVGRNDLASIVTLQGALTGLQVHEGYERAWREVGLAIDRVGFTVEDRDRSKGTYFVRYVDLDRRDPRQGALSRMFSGERKDLTGQRYRIQVEAGATDNSRVEVRDENGQLPNDEADIRVANRIVTLLHERMR